MQPVIQLSNELNPEIPDLETLRVVRYLLRNQDPFVTVTRHKRIKGLGNRKRKPRIVSQPMRRRDAISPKT